MNYPKKIKILSDDNEIKFDSIKPKTTSSPLLINYVYTLSETKLGMVLPLTEDDLQKLFSKSIAIEI